MLTFKNKGSGLVVEVTEEFAEQVLRPQGKYEEIVPEKEVIVKKKISRKKVSKKKVKNDNV